MYNKIFIGKILWVIFHCKTLSLDSLEALKGDKNTPLSTLKFGNFLPSKTMQHGGFLRCCSRFPLTCLDVIAYFWATESGLPWVLLTLSGFAKQQGVHYTVHCAYLVLYPGLRKYHQQTNPPLNYNPLLPNFVIEHSVPVFDVIIIPQRLMFNIYRLWPRCHISVQSDFHCTPPEFWSYLF